jgi:hypothetical protein
MIKDLGTLWIRESASFAELSSGLAWASSVGSLHSDQDQSCL